MAQSPVRLRCPSCHQKLRLLNVASDKRSIHCPLCNAKVSLDRHRRQGEPAPAPPVRHDVSVFGVQYDDENPFAVTHETAPLPRTRRTKKRAQKLSSWTFWQSLRLAIGAKALGWLIALVFVAIMNTRVLIHVPDAHNAIGAVIFLPPVVFWSGVTLWILNVFDQYDWSDLAKSLCIWGLGLIVPVAALVLILRNK